MEPERNFQLEFVKQCHYRMDESLRMVQRSFENLSEEMIWQKPNAVSNSIGNLILHLCGNITQYGIASLKGKADERDRDSEFNTEGGFNKSMLLSRLGDTVKTAKESFEQLPSLGFLEEKGVQGFHFSGIGRMLHVVEHFSYHTGQIALWTKILTEKDLGFYEDFDLNQKNES
ncbi:MAG: DinB family protein [Bacteroidota bacterium]